MKFYLNSQMCHELGLIFEKNTALEDVHERLTEQIRNAFVKWGIDLPERFVLAEPFSFSKKRKKRTKQLSVFIKKSDLAGWFEIVENENEK